MTEHDIQSAIRLKLSELGYYTERINVGAGYLIPKKLIPPTRLARWCCSELKEGGGKGRLKVTGVRWDESRSRKENAGVVRIIGKEKGTQKYLNETGVEHSVNKQGGVVLNLDNAGTRRAVEHCYRTTSTMVNPIVDWTDSDVWDFLKHYGCQGNPLYQCGERRIGCIGCPMLQQKNMRKDFARYPKYKANYIRAFQKMVDARKQRGLTNNETWSNGLAVFNWWIGYDANQLTFFDDDEIDEIMLDMGITT